MGAFRYDGPLMSLLTKVGNMIIVTFFWLAACIPIVTIVPASAALYHTTAKIVRAGGAGVARDFFAHFRASLKKGVPLTLICIATGALLYNALVFGRSVWAGGLPGAVYFAFGILLAFIWASMALFIPPAFSRFEAGVVTTLRLALYLASANLPRTAWFLLLLVLFVFLVGFYPIALFILPGLYTDLICSGMEKTMLKYMRDNGLQAAEAARVEVEDAAEARGLIQQQDAPPQTGLGWLRLEGLVKIYPYTKIPGWFWRRKRAEAALERERRKPYTTDEGVIAVRQFDLEIKRGEFFVLLGPSGCGKSTVLRMIAGLEDASDGQIVMDGAVLNEAAPEQRDIAMIFQNYSLYPHLTVYDNIAFPLKSLHVPREELNQAVRDAAKLLCLTDVLGRLPKELSGGQRQRVAIGRAIVRKPKLFLMDEPFSNLDAPLRRELRAEVKRLHERLGVTIVYVTHDHGEAFELGDRIAVMRDGFIEQIGTAAQLYDAPANLYTAAFIGTPQMNLTDARLHNDGGQWFVNLFGAEYPLSSEQTAGLTRGYDGASVKLGIRPAHIAVGESGIKAEVDYAEHMGAEIHLHLLADGRPLVAALPAGSANPDVYARHTTVYLALLSERFLLFDALTEARIL